MNYISDRDPRAENLATLEGKQEVNYPPVLGDIGLHGVCPSFRHQLDLRDGLTNLLETWHRNRLRCTVDAHVLKILI